ncbi:MAG: lipopolysaccharide heptosyltransferase II [Burkholderiales bacterium]
MIVAPSWVGDAVLSQSLLIRLKDRHPRCGIDVLAPGWVLPVFRRMREVARTFDSAFGHGELALWRRAKLARQLRANGYGRAYVLPNSLKSALIPWLARIPRRIGFVGELRYGLLTDARALDETAIPLMAERFAWLAQPSAEPVERPIPAPRLAVDSTEAAGALTRLGLQHAGRIACFCPGAEYGPAKRWPAAYFAALARTLAEQGHAIWLLGSNKDAAIGAQIEALSGGVARNLCGITSLDDAIVLLSAAGLVVTNDSGLMHVAAALDRPTIAIYGSSSPRFTPPLSQAARVVKLDIACSPCFERVCPLKHFDCMMKLTPERVLDHARRLVHDA